MSTGGAAATGGEAAREGGAGEGAPGARNATAATRTKQRAAPALISGHLRRERGTPDMPASAIVSEDGGLESTASGGGGIERASEKRTPLVLATPLSTR